MPKPNIAQKLPFVLEMAVGTYAWCACGNSKNQPFCDGSHRGTEFQPLITKIEQKKKVVWCGCKHTKSKPWCDGTHKQFNK